MPVFRSACRLHRIPAVVTLLLSGGTFIAATEPPIGLLNSAKGDVLVNGAPASAGATALQSGGVIRTKNGMAELLLTPGTFLRLGERTELNLEAASPHNVRAKLIHGEALLEVLAPQTPIILDQNGAVSTIRKSGLYDFHEKRGAIAVYAGEASVAKSGARIIVAKGLGVSTHNFREFRAAPRPGSLLVSWSNSRSEQLSSESAASAQTWTGNPDTWGGPAWYWNPWCASYTFLSASGFVTSPFGWPFYAPGHSGNYLPCVAGAIPIYTGRQFPLYRRQSRLTIGIREPRRLLFL